VTATETSVWLPIIGYFSNLPLILVWLAGGALAMRHWRQQPKVSQLCFVSMAVLLLWFLLESGLRAVLPMLLERLQLEGELVWAYMVLAALGHLVMALAFGLLLWALFSGRDKAL